MINADLHFEVIILLITKKQTATGQFIFELRSIYISDDMDDHVW